MIAILSALIIITPFLGVPDSWKTTLIVILGLIIFFKSFYSYRMNKTEKVGDKNTAFTQNNYLDDKEIKEKVDDPKPIANDNNKEEIGDLQSIIDSNENEEDNKIEADGEQLAVGDSEERKEKKEDASEIKVEINGVETEVEKNKSLS